MFVAGPIDSSGPTHLNLRAALEEGRNLLMSGYQPFIPHFGVTWEQTVGKVERDVWVSWCQAWLSKCDLLIRLPGYSVGADGEVDTMIKRGLPVFNGYAQLIYPLAALKGQLMREGVAEL